MQRPAQVSLCDLAQANRESSQPRVNAGRKERGRPEALGGSRGLGRGCRGLGLTPPGHGRV